jgi:hypothetical protein
LNWVLRSEYLGADRVCTDDEPLPPFDTHAPLGSLPNILGAAADTVPAEVPYVSHLDLDPATWAHWQERLDQCPGLRVGLLKGEAGARAVPPEAFDRLQSAPGVSVINLSLSGPSRPGGGAPADPAAAFDGWSGPDLAAVLAGLDLVVGVDCAGTHLAGALGLPLWVALPFVPHWRWLLGREDSPWYPTARLFRQVRPGDWADVFERIAAELARWSRSRPAKVTRRHRNEIDFTGAVPLDNW